MCKFLFNSGETVNASTDQNNVQVTLKVFPHFMTLDIWVEARNLLGAEESEHLSSDANCFGKAKFSPLEKQIIIVQSTLCLFWPTGCVQRNVSVWKCLQTTTQLLTVYFVAAKTNPPVVRAISESVFPTSLLVSWTSPIDEVYIKLKYQIRFCPNGSQIWSYVSMFKVSFNNDSSFSLMLN